MLKIGMIGCGMVAQGHMEALRQSRQWHLAAIAEIDPRRRQEAMDGYHPNQSFGDYRQMLSTDKHFEIVHAKFAESISAGCLIDLASGYDGLKATEAAYQALASAKRSG